MSVEFHSDSFGRAKIMPMADPSWDAIIALPDGTEVLMFFVLPLGVALNVMTFTMTDHNREGVCHMRDDHGHLPTYAAYVLPDIEIPDPEAFLASDNPRKDADK